MTPRTAIALLALAGLTFAACGSDDSGSSDGGPTAADLDGRTFVSTEVTGHDLVEGTEINMTFLADAMKRERRLQLHERRLRDRRGRADRRTVRRDR